MKFGMMSQVDFAKVLGISQSYLNQLFQGRHKSINKFTALHIAQVLGDNEILEILGYQPPPVDLRPQSTGKDVLPPEISSALSEAREKISKAGLIGGSPESIEILNEALKKVGYKLTSISDDPSDDK